MNSRLYLIVFSTIIATTVPAVAQEVYRNVDEKGVVEFSDQPSPGADAIEVSPNVVDLAPAKPASQSPQKRKSSAGAQPGSPPQDSTEYYYGDYDSRRERHKERKERRERREEIVQPGPKHNETQRAPAQGGARHR